MIISKRRTKEDEEEKGDRTQVLFVEDDEVDQMALKRSFESDGSGFIYTIAGSVREAKKKLANKKFDIVVIDFILGDGTAFDVLQNIGNISIIVTGQGSVEVALEALKAGVSDYLIKEPNHSHLLAMEDVIKDTIKNHQTEQKTRMFSEALLCVKDCVCITDMDQKIVYVNQAFQNLFRHPEKEILGQPLKVLLKEGVTSTQSIVKNKWGQDEFIVNIMAEGKNGK